MSGEFDSSKRLTGELEGIPEPCFTEMRHIRGGTSPSDIQRFCGRPQRFCLHSSSGVVFFSLGSLNPKHFARKDVFSQHAQSSRRVKSRLQPLEVVLSCPSLRRRFEFRIRSNRSDFRSRRGWKCRSCRGVASATDPTRRESRASGGTGETAHVPLECPYRSELTLNFHCRKLRMEVEDHGKPAVQAKQNMEFQGAVPSTSMISGSTQTMTPRDWPTYTLTPLYQCMQIWQSILFGIEKPFMNPVYRYPFPLHVDKVAMTIYDHLGKRWHK